MTAVIDAQPFVTAVAAALAAGPSPVSFADSAKPASVGTRPYVVGFFDSGTVEDRSLLSRDGWSTVGTFHCVGLSPEASRIAVRKLRAAILGMHRQVIAGRQVLMPEHLTAVPMQRDDDADPTLFIQIDEWRIRTSPA